MTLAIRWRYWKNIIAMTADAPKKEIAKKEEIAIASM
jgi:hypothetical protein